MSVIGAAAYGALGLAECLAGVGLTASVAGHPDLVRGAIMLVVAMVFAAGVRPLRRREDDAAAFAVVGVLLGGILFVIELAVLLTDMLGWALRLEDWLSWSLMDSLDASLFLFPLCASLLALLSLRSTSVSTGGDQP